MTDEKPKTICANVSLVANGEDVRFKYEGADQLSKGHLNKDGEGNIDCAEPRDLGGSRDRGNGPVNLEFQLQTKTVTLNGVDYDLEFEGKKSMGIKEKPNDDFAEKWEEGTASHLMHCLLEALHVTQGQFGGYTNPGGNPHKLRVTNQNNDKKRYKYTLRVKGRCKSDGAVLWLEDDPIIQNGGGGVQK